MPRTRDQLAIRAYQLTEQLAMTLRQLHGAEGGYQPELITTKSLEGLRDIITNIVGAPVPAMSQYRKDLDNTKVSHSSSSVPG